MMMYLTLALLLCASFSLALGLFHLSFFIMTPVSLFAMRPELFPWLHGIVCMVHNI